MLKKALKEGDALEKGKTYSPIKGCTLLSISSGEKGYTRTFTSDDTLRVVYILTAKTWDSFRRKMTTQYTVTFLFVKTGKKYIDVLNEGRIHTKYELTVDSKKVLSGIMEGL